MLTAVIQFLRAEQLEGQCQYNQMQKDKQNNHIHTKTRTRQHLDSHDAVREHKRIQV
jgi:hypothetical protein